MTISPDLSVLEAYVIANCDELQETHDFPRHVTEPLIRRGVSMALDTITRMEEELGLTEPNLLRRAAIKSIIIGYFDKWASERIDIAALALGCSLEHICRQQGE